MADKDPRITSEAWDASQNTPIVIGNRVLPLMNASRQGCVSTLRFGDKATLYKQDGDWSLIAGEHDQYLGWAHGLFRGETASENRARVSNLSTFIFPEPNIKTPSVARLSLGSWVDILGWENEFQQTTQGYIFSEHLKREGDAVSYAEQFLNVPYLWGGGSCDGIDCSGLTQLCHSMAGVEIPRDSDQQEAALQEISRDDATRGDLVYWKGHVGILRDANTMIHATAFAMKTIEENLDHAIRRIGPPTSLRRVF